MSRHTDDGLAELLALGARAYTRTGDGDEWNRNWATFSEAAEAVLASQAAVWCARIDGMQSFKSDQERMAAHWLCHKWQQHLPIETPSATLNHADRIRGALLSTEAVKALEPPEPLIDGLLFLNTLAMLYGESGVMKTFVSIDMTMHVGNGAWWQGRSVTGGGALNVIGEGVSGTGQRLEALERHHRMTGTVHRVEWLPWPLNLASAEWVAAFVDVAAEIMPKLIVFDTLARCTLGAEENSAKDMGQVIAHLDAIRRSTGACVLVVHHTGKDTSAGGRGSSALKAAMDTELQLSGADGRLVLKTTKQKDAPEAAPIHLAAVPVDGTGSLAITGAQYLNVDDIPEKFMPTLDALSAIDVPGGVPLSVWANSVDMPQRTFYRHRRVLLDAGLIVNIGTEKTPRYRPTDAIAGDVK